MPRIDRLLFPILLRTLGSIAISLLFTISTNASPLAAGNFQQYLSATATPLNVLPISIAQLCVLTSIHSRTAVDVSISHAAIDRFLLREAFVGSRQPLDWTTAGDANFAVEGRLSSEGRLFFTARTASGPRSRDRPRAQHLNAQLEIRRIMAAFGDRIKSVHTTWWNSSHLGDNFSQFIASLNAQGVSNPYNASSEQHLRSVASTFSGQLFGRLGFTDVRLQLMDDDSDTFDPPTQIHGVFTRPIDADPLPAPAQSTFRVLIDDRVWAVEVPGGPDFQIRVNNSNQAEVSFSKFPDGPESDKILIAAKSWLLTRHPNAQVQLYFGPHISPTHRAHILVVFNGPA